MTNPSPATSENHPSRISRWCSSTWNAIEEAKVLARLDGETIRILAHDNALSEDDLASLMRRGPHAADEMVALMRALNIDPEKARLAEPLEFRDMHVTCSKCTQKARCRQELADGSAAADFAGYCGNSEHLDAMRTPSPQL